MSLTEGTVDVGRADYYLSARAREIAPAKIVGTYGSEIMRHAVMFKPVEPADGLFAPEFLPRVHEAASAHALMRRQHPVTFAAFIQSPLDHHGVLALEKSQLTVHSPYMDNDFVRTVYRAPSLDAANGDVRIRLISDENPMLGRVRSDRGLGGNAGRFRSALTNVILEFTFKAEYAYDYGMPQSVARVDQLRSPLSTSNGFFWDATSSFTSGSGTATGWRVTFVRCCSIRYPCRGPTSRERRWRPSSNATSRGTGTTRLRFTGFSPWNCCTVSSWMAAKPARQASPTIRNFLK